MIIQGYPLAIRLTGIARGGREGSIHRARLLLARRIDGSAGVTMVSEDSR